MNDQDSVINSVQPIINVPDPGSVNDSTLQGVLSTVFLAAGGLALVFIAVGGLRYVISQGDPQKVQQAKESIIYALVGLVVSVSAFAIVSFVYGVL
jgi:uncharacterized membrane protein YidH (DUF202 family)